jgi:Zn-dependent protease
MFRHTIPIGRIFGISVDLDLSWFLLIGLLTWMLAVSYYPVEFPGWTIGQYWLMGLVTALLLFASVLIHELGHSVVAKGYGMSVPRIVLFIFGAFLKFLRNLPARRLNSGLPSLVRLLVLFLPRSFGKLSLSRPPRPNFSHSSNTWLT